MSATVPGRHERAIDPDPGETLAALRRRMDAVDDRLLAALHERLVVAREMGRLKRRAALPGRDPAREAAVIARLVTVSDVDPDAITALWRVLFAASLAAQAEPADPSAHQP